jgi:hypothetical protein
MPSLGAVLQVGVVGKKSTVDRVTVISKNLPNVHSALLLDEHGPTTRWPSGTRHHRCRARRSLVFWYARGSFFFERLIPTLTLKLSETSVRPR